MQKNILILLLLFFTGSICAQELNQFDSNGKRHGKWQKNFEDTKQLRYKGQFDHGKEVGLFTYYQLVGKISMIAAIKEFNTTNSIAKVKYISLKGKTISEGNMDNKAYVGKWLYYHKNSDQLMTVENYNNRGNLDGKRTVYYENGQKAEETVYVDAKIQGISNFYSLSGALVKLYTYKNNELHGNTKHYNEDGSLTIEGQYQNGHKHGVWKYYRNGKVYGEKDFTRRTKNPKKKKN